MNSLITILGNEISIKEGKEMGFIHLERQICDYKISYKIAGENVELVLEYEKSRKYSYKLNLFMDEWEREILSEANPEKTYNLIAGRLRYYITTIEAHTGAGLNFDSYENLVKKNDIEWLGRGK